jgi:non-ribosomal peptide synthetase component E (peptide arylation enzyme)
MTGAGAGRAGTDVLSGAEAQADPLSCLDPVDRTRPALRTATQVLTYGEFDELVDRRARQLHAQPAHLLPVSAGRDVASVVELLAAWRARRVVLMLPPDHEGSETRQRLLDAWPPSGATGQGHDLHPELALLMSTSGSTGSPKLVRLSHANLSSNAAAIAEYLRITGDDVALTTLPLHYCYGLSVLTSHLRARASLLLTEDSVTSPGLWDLATRHGVTSFAGVPHTFELLHRSAQVERLPATLRYVTQAGGRLAPEGVRRWAAVGTERGFDFVVMYGQTEATARMAWLPPALAAARPDAIGVPIPGGSLRVDPVDLPGGVPQGTGELVYRGPNVMQGYAVAPADLARGDDLTELRTGDLGVQDDDGIFRVVGRLARFAKVYGLRIDLDAVEGRLASAGVEARALEVAGRLVVFSRRAGLARVRAQVLAACGLPAHAVEVVPVDSLPVTGSGKRDDAPLRALVSGAAAGETPADDVPLEEQVRATYALLLGRPDATADDSFVGLRGDSLSFVEANVRLGALLDRVPHDWPRLTPRELAARERAVPEPAARAPRETTRRWPCARWPRLDSSLVLRAVAIVLVVGSHTDVWMVPGGAHTLLALLGFSLVRFPMAEPEPAARTRRLARMTAGIMGPALLVGASVALLRGTYDWATVVGLNNLLGEDTWTEQWRWWFVEAVGWGLLVVMVLLRLPATARLERVAPYLFPLGLVLGSLLVRWAWIGLEADNPQRYSLPFVWTFLLLGWLVARSVTPRQRLITAATALVATLGFFGDPVREAVVLGALAVLLWVPQVRVPRRLVPLLGVVAASSLWTYLVHWEVYPPVEEVSEPLAFVVSFSVGILTWWTWTRGTRRLRRAAGHLLPPLSPAPGGARFAGWEQTQAERASTTSSSEPAAPARSSRRG